MAVGLLAIAVTVVVALSDAAPRLAATNARVDYSGRSVDLDPGAEWCQGGEFVPAPVSHIRVFAAVPGATTSEPLTLTLKDARGRVVASAKGPEGRPPARLDIPFRVRRTLDPATLCVRNDGDRRMIFAGNLTPSNPAAALGPNAPGQRPTDEIRVDWYRDGDQSWWSLLGVVARRASLFKPSFTGPWLLWAMAAGAAVLWAAALATVVRGHRWRPRLRLPAAAWACAAIAVGNAWLWAVLTPPFQVPDEGVHIGYSEYLAETGRPPRRFKLPPRSLSVYSQEYNEIYRGLPFSPEGRPSWSPTLDDRLRERLDGRLDREEELGAGTAATYPPAYYAYEAVAARAGRSLDALDRLFLLRAWSALLAGVTVGATFLFLREVLPRHRWAWAVGALAVAFQPVFSFLSGGVNNDGLLYAASAVLIASIARAFRRGLTLRRALLMGSAVGVGLLTKPTMMGMTPALAVTIAAVLLRDRRWRDRRSLTAGAVALALPVVLVLGWIVVDIGVFDRRAGAMTGDLVSEEVTAATSITGQLSYLWQFYLPRLPFMSPLFIGWTYPLWHVYIQGFVGRFGWFQYSFSTPVHFFGLAALTTIAVLAVVTLVRARAAVRRRWLELGAYVAAVAGVLLMIGVSGYRYRAALGFNFEQTRYLFPLLAFYGGAVALAARAGGRRWGPVIGVSAVVLAMGHWLFAVLLTVERYYG
jgi:hypothetical protein